MNILKRMNFLCLFATLLVAFGLTASPVAAATAPQQALAPKKIAFLPVIQVPMERETPISQILANDVIDFAALKNAVFVDDALLMAVLEKHHYAALDPKKPLDLTLVKRIQQDLGADLVIAVRVEALSQDESANNGSSSILLVRPAVKMQVAAASAGQEKAWLRAIENQDVVDYSLSGDLGPERLASQKFNSFLQAAWRKS